MREKLWFFERRALLVTLLLTRGEVSTLFEASSSVLSRLFNSNPTLSSGICDKRRVFLVVPHVP